MTKVRATRHNGRAGKNGVFTTKHNDRNFDISHAEHIDPARTIDNVYWDWQNGLRTGEQQVYECEDGSIPSFDDAEKAFYEQRYSGYIAGQCERNAKRRHSERNRTADQLRRDKRTCPEESIYQFGRDGGGATPEQLLAIFKEFQQRFTERYGEHIHILDWAMHCDETTVHIQERHCFDYTNEYGEIEPKQEKALEALGIPLPHPDKPQGRYNNRKVTFDAMNRLMLIEIAKAHGLDIEEQVKYGGKQHMEKLDFIIARQLETIQEQERQLAQQAQQIETLTVQIEAQTTLLAEKDAEIEARELKLEDVDALLDEVADIAYDRAMKTVAVNVVKTVQNKSEESIEKVIRKAQSKDSGLNVFHHSVVMKWLTLVHNSVKNAFEGMVSDVIDKLSLPAMKKAAKAKIKETAMPAVVERLKPRMTEKKKRDEWVR